MDCAIRHPAEEVTITEPETPTVSDSIERVVPDFGEAKAGEASERRRNSFFKCETLVGKVDAPSAAGV